jgi:hypothetical protein
MDGVIPNTIVMGLMIGADGRDIGPIRRSRTAASKWGYQVADDGARVGKSLT